MKRVGIIGCGQIAARGHQSGYGELADRISVVAVADPAAERRGLLGDRFQIPAPARYDDYRDLLARDDLDFVDICLPHHLHHPATLAAAAAGHNILLEKPIAAREDEALEMIAAVEQAGIVFSLIHNYSRQSVPARILELVHGGAIGSPYLVRYEGFGDYHYLGTAAYDPAWRAEAGRGGGGALLDNGYHSIYLARYVMQSEVREVFGAVGTFARDFEVEDTALALLRHENGAITSIQNGWGADRSMPAREVQGSTGSILLRGNAERPIELWNGDRCEYPAPMPAPPSDYAQIFSAYCDALDGAGPVPTTAADGLMNLRIILAAYEASRAGRVVTLP